MGEFYTEGDQEKQAADALSIKRFELFKKAQSGDTQALDQLVEDLRERYNRVGYTTFQNTETAHDYAQDIVIKLFQNLPDISADNPMTLNAWLRAVSEHLKIDYLRKAARRKEDSSGLAGQADEGEEMLSYDHELSVPDTTSKRLNQSIVKKSVDEALATLRPDHLTVTRDHHLEGKKIDDIAREEKVSPGTVKSRLARAREILARKLNAIKERE